MKAAYYNEIDPFSVQWLKHLMNANMIAPGEIDGRDIRDVQPEDIRGFTQWHFFAGIGVWSYALRLAGWPDDRPVRTGSCPCPSFSCAGKGTGFDDPRHLWPAWERLIPERDTAAIFGEQSDEAIGFGWLDLVQTDLERKGYAVGKAVFGAAGVGAPHARLRLYFCAYAKNAEWRRANGAHHSGRRHPKTGRRDDVVGRLQSNGARLLTRRIASPAVGHGNSTDATGSAIDSTNAGCTPGLAEYRQEQGSEMGRRAPEIDYARIGPSGELGNDGNTARGGFGVDRSAPREAGHAEQSGAPGIAAYADSDRRQEHFWRSGQSDVTHHGSFGGLRTWRGSGWLDPDAARSIAEAGATRGFWGDCDWWHGKDGKFRPIGDGLFPLAHGIANRVGKLRGYGNAIVAPQAEAFIRAAMEVL